MEKLDKIKNKVNDRIIHRAAADRAKQEKKERLRASKFKKYAAKTKKKTGWTLDKAKKEMSAAAARTGCTSKEYFIYRFYELTPEEQDKVFLIKHSQQLSEKYDVDRKLNRMLVDKAAANLFFHDLVRRPWCVNTIVSKETFERVFTETDHVIYKPLDGHRGKGIKDYHRENGTWDTAYAELSNLAPGVVEAYVVQHPRLNELAPSSVNTIRIVTVSSNKHPVTKDGAMYDVAYASLRIGAGTSIVDNFHSGGMVANIDLNTGRLITDAADQDGNTYTEHPVTGTVFKGFEIPFFFEAKEMVEEAIRTKHVQGYLGWDIAITENGPVLIELNLTPGVVLIQAPYAAEHKGMKYIADKYL